MVRHIKSQTSLSVFGISGKKEYTKMCIDKDTIIKTCDENDIILVKSTMYKKFIGRLENILVILHVIMKCMNYQKI